MKLVLAPIYLREKLINPFSTQYTFLSGAMEKRLRLFTLNLMYMDYKEGLAVYINLDVNFQEYI